MNSIYFHVIVTVWKCVSRATVPLVSKDQTTQDNEASRWCKTAVHYAGRDTDNTRLTERSGTTYLPLVEGEGLAVGVGFDAAGVVRGGAVKDLHQALQRVLQPGGDHKVQSETSLTP